IHRARLWTDRLYQPVIIAGIARLHDITLETLNRKNPAKLSGEITIFGFGEHVVERLLIGLTGGIGASRRLSEFLLNRETREARPDPANRINVGNGHGGCRARAGWAGCIAC